MTHRLEIALDEARLARLRDEARALGLSVDALVLRALALDEPAVPDAAELRRRGRAALAAFDDRLARFPFSA